MEEKSKVDYKVDSIRNSHFNTIHFQRAQKLYENNELLELFLKVNVAVIYKEVARLINSGGFLFLHPFKQK